MLSGIKSVGENYCWSPMNRSEALTQDRLEKLAQIKKLGVDPYPADSKKTHGCEEVKKIDPLASLGTKVFVCGRITSIRLHGKAGFADLIDESGKIQIFVGYDLVGDKDFQLFKLLDPGDFLEAGGEIFTTKTGQKTLKAKSIKLLSKALKHIPDAHQIIKNKEELYRKRYLDILTNPETRELIIKRTKFWASVRNFMLKHGFFEVETPVLETTTGGADAKPFMTHHNALDADLFLRISMGELWQKKLLVAGFEKTFEIGRQFRNEGMDFEHLQEYTQMEFYWAYADYNQGMELVEELYKYVARKTFGTLKFDIGEHKIDLGKKWQRYDYREMIKKYTSIDILKTDLSQIKKKLDELKVEYDKKGFNITRAIDNLWKYCRKQIAGPGFLTGIPVTVSPLAKRDPKNPNLTQRFQPIIAGSELGNGYSELNDPTDQRERFIEQEKLRAQGDEEAQMKDDDFVEALEYGMPPACGFGMSERVFAFLAGKQMRECQIFPLMKAKDK